MSRTVIIAQARMSSTRLPGKVMMDLGGRPVVDHVIERARRATLADDVWLATSTDPSDDVLADHFDELRVPYVRGPLDDVLARYVQAAAAAEADTIVRVTCDCPLIDPEVIDTVIAAFREEPTVDYCSNTLERSYPIGMDTEVFSRDALERASAEATEPYEREHVTPYLREHTGKSRLRNVEAPQWARRPELRLTVDEESDLRLVREVVSGAGPDAGLHAILALLDARPSLAELNRHVEQRFVDTQAS